MFSTSFWLPLDKVADFNFYKVIYDLEGRLVNETPLRVGIGRNEQLASPTDLPVIKISSKGGRELPYIPGSSLKGVMRSHLERIAAAIYGSEAVHSPFDIKRIWEDEYEKERVCAICGIFGTAGGRIRTSGGTEYLGVASHVIVKDSLPLGNPPLMLKPGIGINRDFGGVQPVIGPFYEEYVFPGTEWSFNMRIINITIEDEQGDDPRPRLLRLLVSSLRNGELQVGGRKSIGAGIISLKDLRIWRKIIEDGEIRAVEVRV